jgi:hypothetical protein
MLMPHAALELAKERWVRTHRKPWPYDPPRAFGGSPTFTLDEVAEADALVDAARFSDSPGSDWNRQPVDPAAVARVRGRLEVLIGAGTPPPDLWWKADWSLVRNMNAAPPASLGADQEAAVDWLQALQLPEPINPYPTRTQQLPAEAQGRLPPLGSGLLGGRNPDGSYRPPAWDTVNELIGLIDRYFASWPPEVQLAQQVNVLNIAIKEKWPKASIDHIRSELSQMAMDYKHHFEDGVV